VTAAAKLLPFRAPRGSRRVEEHRELCVILACHDLVCALPVRWIERLILPDEVAIIAGGRQTVEAATRTWQVILVGEQRYAACNLGTLFGLAPLQAAWALLRVPHRGVDLPIAVQTGPCLVVQALAPGVPLPTSLFARRAGCIAAVFPTKIVRSALPLPLGLWLDPSRLWAESELDAAQVALGRESESGA
jgi:hypothetical protein